MASRILEILTHEESHPDQRRAKTLVRSLAVLEEWLDRNEGCKDEVRVRRIRRLRGEALEQLGLLLEPGRL